MKSPDIVAEFAALAREAGVDQVAANRMADRIRSQYGGQKVRILPREPITLEQIDCGLRQGKPVRVIACDLGVSRATVYRHLKPKVSNKR